MHLLVLKAGPSVHVTVSILTVLGVVVGSSTNYERQSAALFLAPEIHSKAMLYVASSRLHLFNFIVGIFFHLGTSQEVYDHFLQ